MAKTDLIENMAEKMRDQYLMGDDWQDIARYAVATIVKDMQQRYTSLVAENDFEVQFEEYVVSLGFDLEEEAEETKEELKN